MTESKRNRMIRLLRADDPERCECGQWADDRHSPIIPPGRFGRETTSPVAHPPKMGHGWSGRKVPM